MARKQGSHSDITGPKIRAAALRLIAQNGFAAVSMRQIAAEVGVQAGALYNYTPDKQSLLLALLQAHMDELMDGWQACDVPAAPDKALRTFVDFHIVHHYTRQDSLFISYMELRNLTPENFEILEARRRLYEAELEGILTRGQTAGVFNLRDVRLATMAIIPMLNGVSAWFRDDGRLSLDEICEQYWAFVKGIAEG